MHPVPELTQADDLLPDTAVAVYWVIAEPPLLLGASQFTANAESALATWMPVGDEGTPDGVREPNAAGIESPAAFVAVTDTD